APGRRGAQKTRAHARGRGFESRHLHSPRLWSFVSIATPGTELVTGLSGVPVQPERFEAVHGLVHQIGVSADEPERSERERLEVGAVLDERAGRLLGLLAPA